MLYNEPNTYIFTGSCKAATGVVAKITSYFSANDGYICALEQFDDQLTETFFMRAVIRMNNKDIDIDKFKNDFNPIANELSMQWQLFDPNTPVKTLIMVSKFDHCLDDLLYRKRNGDLPIEVTAIVSNHQDLRPMVEREGISFIHLPISKANKIEQEKRLLEIYQETGSELVVLARYMQILTDQMAKKLTGHCINIHHSFLPGFKGAKPYLQAFERGVKLIGATAHYVTGDLDEGPIIEQMVTRVDHNMKPDHLERLGRDIECMVLAKAVFIDQNKTVVFTGS